MSKIREESKRATALAGIMGMYFCGQEPGIIGCVLADLMSTFLINHQIPNDLAEQDKLREQILSQWCEAVRELVAVYEMQGATKQ